jgi:peptidoglycan/LPS O-acetylase OafA/YrhL
LTRLFKPRYNVKHSFWICGAVLVALLASPRIGGEEYMWMNGLYDALCCIAFFPLLVYLGASDKSADKTTAHICKFLGDLSYPLYIVHYPYICIYYSWVKTHNLTFGESIYGAAAVVVGSLITAWLCMAFYDIPVRGYLTGRFLKSKNG